MRPEIALSSSIWALLKMPFPSSKGQMGHVTPFGPPGGVDVLALRARARSFLRVRGAGGREASVTGP